MLGVLIFCLIVILIFNYVTNQKEIIAPSVVFTGSFLIACIWAIFYEKKWSLNLHINTFWVIVAGILTFTIVSLLIRIVFSTRETQATLQNNELSIDVVWWKTAVVCLLIGVSIWYTINTIKRIEPASTLSDSIFLYRTQSMNPLLNTSYIALPKTLIFLQTFSESAGYFFAYLFSKELLESKKFNISFFLVILLSVTDSILLGGRTTAFRILICTLIYLYCIYKKNKNWSSKGNVKSIGIAIAAMFVVIFLFQLIATFLGRDTESFSGMDYLAMYVGAEIKNLDIFLQSGNFPIGHDWGGQTFISIHNVIANHLGIGKIVNLELPFMYVNGYNLGNVYTTFYPYIYDFGYMGVPILTAIIAFISQLSFEFMRKGNGKANVPLAMLIYSRILVTLLLSFFSNKFYEELLAPSFFEVIVVWWIFNWLLLKKKS